MHSSALGCMTDGIRACGFAAANVSQEEALSVLRVSKRNSTASTLQGKAAAGGPALQLH